MKKWADYCISKQTLVEKSFESFYLHQDLGESLGAGNSRDRNWVVQKMKAGKTFCTIDKSLEDGKWFFKSKVEYVNGAIKTGANLPRNLTRRKTFISYYHKEDQDYKNAFLNGFGDLIINKSVEDGDINAENKDDYIKQLIQQDFLKDTTVLVVLVGKNTLNRKHIDWEISGALDYKVGDHYSGLIGILLPDHPDYNKKTYSSENLPARLAANADSGYAKIYDWTNYRVSIQKRIEDAYHGRKLRANQRVNRSVKQKIKNSGN